METKSDQAVVLKNMADLAIADLKIEYIFQRLYQAILAMDPNASVSDFDYYAALYLKKRYHIHISDLLQQKPKKLIDIPAVNDVLDSQADDIDKYFLLFTAKMKAFSEHHKHRGFFLNYHRRDIKQQAMLRSFIMARKRLRDFSKAEISYHVEKILPDPFNGGTTLLVLKLYADWAQNAIGIPERFEQRFFSRFPELKFESSTGTLFCPIHMIFDSEYLDRYGQHIPNKFATQDVIEFSQENKTQLNCGNPFETLYQNNFFALPPAC
ncbi:hypothetical protein SNE25_19710 [Mucilaginibacter sabulilitoris]|uniref:Uncharacterized protein n=1 Tax=Mucilaginibacter sabulilitoris TaxID=1173583 RepID=A0ABZ0TH37_9SPHI|nr:hypothetical protein [Mucilaginibacter sabulilitoris]WPU91548.1 hypothetical protein SNE25_19710 [Mucilaginibacter sabulilitoris]